MYTFDYIKLNFSEFKVKGNKNQVKLQINWKKLLLKLTVAQRFKIVRVLIPRAVQFRKEYSRKTDKRYEQKFCNKESVDPKHNYSKICELQYYSTIFTLNKNFKNISCI